MTPDQATLAQSALAQMKTISIQAPQPHDVDSLSDLLARNDILNASISLADFTATGFSRAGLAALDALAQSFRPPNSRNSRLASNATVAKMIAGRMIEQWKGRTSDSLTTADYEAFGNAIDQWFASLTHVRQHVIPCTLVPYPLPSFTIGPVMFHHLHNFPSEAFGVTRKDFWPTPPSKWEQWRQNVWAAICNLQVQRPAPGGFYFEQIIRLAMERYAPWMALVDVVGRADAESVAAADIATDIALAAIQLALHHFDLRGLARATGRSGPVWRADVCKGVDGAVRGGTSNREPARAIAPDLFALGLSQTKSALNSMGRRLSSYLNATSTLPDLDEAWCNAAYWYHEALAEMLDTVAVAKLETAIEVLFRAESMSGSERRLLDSFDAIFGFKEHDPIVANSSVTAGQVVVSITTARSRVLHGTWPTLHTDLPSTKGGSPITYSDVELLARLLLVEFSRYIDAYQQAGETTDSTEALIGWIKLQRNSQAAGFTANAPPT